MTRKEQLISPELDMLVFHEGLYDGKVQMKIVGIRKHEVELEGDYSGGTHNVTQKSWMPIEGAFRMRAVCQQVERFGSCPLPNVHCSHPDCEPYV